MCGECFVELYYVLVWIVVVFWCCCWLFVGFGCFFCCVDCCIDCEDLLFLGDFFGSVFLYLVELVWMFCEWCDIGFDVCLFCWYGVDYGGVEVVEYGYGDGVWDWCGCQYQCVWI